jgi:hypothetical protein
MAEAYQARHALPEPVEIPPLPLVPYGETYDYHLDDPTVAFHYDGRIGEYSQLQATQAMALPDKPITTGYDWRERGQDGQKHRLDAIFNFKGQNFGVATTVVDERPFTYVTRIAQKADEGEIIAVLDSADTETHMYDYTDRMDGELSAALTLRRTHDGKLQLVNQGVHEVQVGTAPLERQPDPKGRFGLRNIYKGIQRVLHRTTNASTVERHQWDSNLSGRMGWKPESYQPAQWACWQRQNAAASQAGVNA